MKKVREALRSLKAQVLLRGPGHALRIFFLFLACLNMFFCTFEISFCHNYWMKTCVRL